jgi:hypothetical protein
MLRGFLLGATERRHGHDQGIAAAADFNLK